MTRHAAGAGVTARAAGTGRPLYGIDAGGSGTSVRAWTGEGWTAPPLNPSSVGQDAADRGLSELFARLRAHADRAARPPGQTAARPAIWLASASIDETTAAGQARRYAAAARGTGLLAEVVLSNDVTPLLLSAPRGTGHVIAVCGTGSGFLGTDGRSAPVRVGGCEYLGSDEGSAFDLGLRGLRAAVRSLDGRAPRTALSGLLAAQGGAPVADLARRLAQQPFPKPVVAALAPVVLRAWADGDAVAAGLVADAIGELVAGIRAALAAAAIGPGWRLSVAGGVVAGCPEFYARLAAAAADLGADPVDLVDDPAAAVLAALGQLAGPGPLELSDPRIGGSAWCLPWPGPDRRDAG